MCRSICLIFFQLTWSWVDGKSLKKELTAFRTPDVIAPTHLALLSTCLLTYGLCVMGEVCVWEGSKIIATKDNLLFPTASKHEQCLLSLKYVYIMLWNFLIYLVLYHVINSNLFFGWICMHFHKHYIDSYYH